MRGLAGEKLDIVKVMSSSGSKSMSSTTLTASQFWRLEPEGIVIGSRLVMSPVPASIYEGVCVYVTVCDNVTKLHTSFSTKCQGHINWCFELICSSSSTILNTKVENTR